MTDAYDTTDRLSRREVRALAAAIRRMGDGDFLAVLLKAKSENGGRLAGEVLWRQIASEMAMPQTSPGFPERLKIAAGAIVVFAAAMLCFVKIRMP